MRIFILGGTRGIGLGLAQHYLAAGHTVAVSGRNLARIDALAFAGDVAGLHRFEFDIRNPIALRAAIDSFAEGGLDLLIVCAGKYVDRRHQALSTAELQEILSTNVGGVLLAFDAALAHMLVRRTGHLVALASVAGLLKPDLASSAYSASKRAVLELCQSYRSALRPFDIAVTAVVPGYVDTEKLRELNGGDATAKPFLMTEAQAVKHITSAIKHRRPIAIFPWPMRVIVVLLNLLPGRIRQWVLSRR